MTWKIFNDTEEENYKLYFVFFFNENVSLP